MTTRIFLFEDSFSKMVQKIDKKDIETECEKIKNLCEYDSILWKYSKRELKNLYQIYIKKTDICLTPHFLVHPYCSRILYTSTRIIMMRDNEYYLNIYPKLAKHFLKGDCDTLPNTPFSLILTSKKDVKNNNIWLDFFQDIFPETKNIRRPCEYHFS